LVASAAAPPLAQVREPLGARLHLARLRVLGRLLLVPDREVRGDAAILALDPCRDVGTVVLGDIDARNRQGHIERSGGCGSGQAAGKGGSNQAMTHGISSVSEPATTRSAAAAG